MHSHEHIVVSNRKGSGSGTAGLSTYVRQRLGDPSRTTALRASFERDMVRRFRKIYRMIWQAIVEEDAFGLIAATLGQSNITIQQTQGRRAFAFTRSSDKIAAFMKWLRQEIQGGILDVANIEQVGRSVEGAWTNIYVRDGYRRGVQRARYQLQQGGYNVPSIAQSGGIEAALNIPFHIDRLGLVYTRVFTELQGITNSMDVIASQILTGGISEGLHPRVMARQLIKSFSGGELKQFGVTDRLGRFIPPERRARMLARTEIIRAHAQGQLQEMDAWRAEGVSTMAEWITAGDGRVCERCAQLEGNRYTIEQAFNMLPLHTQCFIDSQTPVYTSKGWKGIGKIKIGDYVLTHMGKFRKVTALIRNERQSPEVIRFYFKQRFHNTHSLTMTVDHPVLVMGSNGSAYWKIAGDCTEHDQLMLLANRCQKCNELIPYNRKFCSHRCNSLSITKRQWENPQHRKNMSIKTSLQLKKEYENGVRNGHAITKNAHRRTREIIKTNPELYANRFRPYQHLAHTPEIRKRSSERMKKSNPMHDPAIVRKAQMSVEKTYHNNPEKRLNARMAKLKKSNIMTCIEKRMDDLLKSIGIPYVYQYPILRYDVDFAIPSLKIVIECDGEYWHRDKNKDAERQKRIEAEGWFVLRYTGSKINQCADEIKNELNRVIFNHTGQYEFMSYPIKQIEKWKIKRPRTLYNLSVEIDESYLAKGFVVHNCRCIWVPVSVSAKTAGLGIQNLKWEAADSVGKASGALKNDFGISLVQGQANLKQINKIGDTIGNKIFGQLPDLRGGYKPTSFTVENAPLIGPSGQAVGTYNIDSQAISVGSKILTKTKDTLGLGFQSNVGTDLSTVIRHEYGHHIYFQNLALEQRAAWTDFFNADPGLFKNWVSSYAGTNASEAFAESFAAYTSPLYDQSVKMYSMPLSIRNMLEKLIGKRTGL